MNVVVYCEPWRGGLGGAELSAAVLAGGLAAEHDVRLVHHRADVTGATLSAFTEVDLSGVETMFVAPPSTDAWGCCTSSNPLTRYAEATRWQAALSKTADVFVNFTHAVPPFNHARTGILVVLFPLLDRSVSWPWADDGTTPVWKRTGRRAYYQWEWARRFRSYGVTLADSQFTQSWTRKRWGVRSSVFYPPVDTNFPAEAKHDSILSVGRFATAGLSKQQGHMVSAFDTFRRDAFPGWRYACVGALGTAEDDQAYYERVRRTAGPHCLVAANLSRAELKLLYARAKVFWHAAGYGESDSEAPEQSEHFGIATVEAMAAGCVPVVINKGGQQEIVRHGANGFLWNTLDELQTFTRVLADDETLWRRMSEQARIDAQAFGKRNRLYQFREILACASGRARSFRGSAKGVTSTY